MSEYKYRLEDIKPKKYPNEKPSNYAIYWSYPGTQLNWTDYQYDPDITYNYPWDSRPIKWFIDIPSAPKELEPLKYPENKPNERGKYLCHIKDDIILNIKHDEWEVMEWRWDDHLLENNWSGYRELVDYFINVNLDVNNDSVYLHFDNKTEIKNDEIDTRKYAQTIQKENKTNVIWDKPPLKVRETKNGLDIQYWTRTSGFRVEIPKEDFEPFVRHWINLLDTSEIAPCPFCRRECYVREYPTIAKGSVEITYKYGVVCKSNIGCGYIGGKADTRSEAIRLHNLIAGKGK